MKEYRKVLEFVFNNNRYNMYLDSSNKHFFLRVSGNGDLDYITIEELCDLVKHFKTIPNVMNISKDSIKEKIKIIPKVIFGGVAITLTFAIMSTGLNVYNSQQRIDEFERANVQEYVLTDEDMKEYVSTDDIIQIQNEEKNKLNEDLVVDTYRESDRLNYLYIYDMDYIDLAFEHKDITLEMLYQEINNNSSISSKFKGLLYEYCDSLVNNYPDVELRVLYENLKSLEVVECDEYELSRHTLSMTASGCYVKDENKIYVLEDKEYEKGTWDYQVIFHELSHCLRNGTYDIDGKDVRITEVGQGFYNTITMESLNSLFAVSLFDYDENDIAYQLQSNYHKVILDCIDNYDLSDYVNHSLSYYAKQLDEFNGDDNYATVILELIQMQYDDFHSEKFEAEQYGYYPIYDYITDMYFNKYISSDMSYDQAKELTDNLVETIMFDVPEEYNIDTNHFYENLDEYCNSIGISVSSRTR